MLVSLKKSYCIYFINFMLKRTLLTLTFNENANMFKIITVMSYIVFLCSDYLLKLIELRI